MKSVWFVRFHKLDQARAVRRFAASRQLDLELLTAEHLVHGFGVAPIFVMEEKLEQRLWVDVGEYAGVALAAIRMGLRHLLFTGDPRVTPKLEDMLRQVGGTLKTRLDHPEIALDFNDDAERRLASELGREVRSV